MLGPRPAHGVRGTLLLTWVAVEIEAGDVVVADDGTWSIPMATDAKEPTSCVEGGYVFHAGNPGCCGCEATAFSTIGLMTRREPGRSRRRHRRRLNGKVDSSRQWSRCSGVTAPRCRARSSLAPATLESRRRHCGHQAPIDLPTANTATITACGSSRSGEECGDDTIPSAIRSG